MRAHKQQTDRVQSDQYGNEKLSGRCYDWEHLNKTFTLTQSFPQLASQN